MEECLTIFCVIVAVMAVVVIMLSLRLSWQGNQLRQMRADSHFRANDIRRLEKLVGGPPKPPDSRLAFEMYGHDVFYKRSKTVKMVIDGNVLIVKHPDDKSN